MIEIRALGGLSISTGGSPRRLTSRKAAALLVYLAVNEGRPLARSELAALLWGGAPSDQARHSLGQALYTLRRELPSLELRTGRHDVLLRSGSVNLDVNRCKDLLSKGNILEGLRLYAGPFTHGFWLADCPEFEDWQEHTRREIDRLVWRSSRQLMASLEEEADWALLEEVTARALLADPYDEDVHRRRLVALGMLGDNHRANREHQAFVEMLRTELDRAPTAETRALALRLDALPGREPTKADEPSASEDIWPFVGRRPEFAQLRDAWHLAARGERQAIVVLGEAGIGKTRLCQRLLRYAALQGARVLEGRCYPIETRLPYSGAVDALLTGLTPEDIMELPPAWSAVVSELLPELAPNAAQSPGAPPRDEVSRRRLFEGITRVLQALSRRVPIVMFLDDFHWADESTAALIHYLTRRLSGSQAMFLVAIRPEELGPKSHIRLLYERTSPPPLFGQIRLSELTPDSVRELVEHFLRANALQLSEELQTSVVQRSAGRPLFIIEFLKAIRAGQAGSRDESGPQKQSIGPNFVPAVIQDLLVRRLRDLSDEALDVVSALAVLGRGAPIRLLVHIIGRPQAATIRGAEQLLAKGLVLDEKDNLTLPHDLLREVAYSSLSAARRRLLHASTASALESSGDTPPGTLAVHFDLAGDKRAAYEYALRAADASEKVSAPGEVDFFLRMAYANARSDSDRNRVEERRAYVAFRFRRYREADALFRELENRYRMSGEPAQVLGCAICRAAIRLKQGSAPASRLIDGLHELLVQAEALGEREKLPQVIKLLAAAAHDAGDRKVVLNMIRKLRKLARTESQGAVGSEILALVGTLSGQYLSGREGLKYSQRAVECAYQSKEPAPLIHALLARGSNLLQLGRLAAAETDCRRALELGERHAILDFRNGALNDLAIVLTEQGEYGEAELLFRRAADHAAEADAWHDLLFVNTNWSLLQVEAGALESAGEMARSVLAAANRVGAWWGSATAWAVLGLRALERGQLAEANRCRREILALFEGRDFWVGDFSYAEMFLARLAAVEGEEERGLDRLDRAVAAYEGRDVMCWSRLQLERARLLMSLDRSEARRTARQVRSRAAVAGARPLVAKAEAILDRLLVKE